MIQLAWSIGIQQRERLCLHSSGTMQFAAQWWSSQWNRCPTSHVQQFCWRKSARGRAPCNLCIIFWYVFFVVSLVLPRFKRAENNGPLEGEKDWVGHSLETLRARSFGSCQWVARGPGKSTRLTPPVDACDAPDKSAKWTVYCFSCVCVCVRQSNRVHMLSSQLWWKHAMFFSDSLLGYPGLVLLLTKRLL